MSKAQGHVNKLGFPAKDILTGMTGVISSISFDINGCIQGWIQPSMKEDKTVPEGKWIDVARLELTSETPVIRSPNYVEGVIADGGSGASDKGPPGSA